MNFKERVPFGRTGLMVSRIGLASGFGVPTAAIEKAFHEYGVNYFWLSFLKRGNMVRAIRNLTPRHRHHLCIKLSWPAAGSLFAHNFVHRWLKKLRLDQVDLIVLQDQRKPPGHKLKDCMNRLKASGKVRFVGISSHHRPLFGKIAKGEVKAPVDFFQVRYNAVHPGAEKDVFPHLPQENRPGIEVFTATCWKKLLKPKLLPAGHHPLTASDCYRFVLSHPDVNVCATGPSTAEQMEQNLKAMDAGPLDKEEMTRIRRIGKYIYETAPKAFME
jgi:aryl-alcohol dehydrogenase-like predicted oxidoreductase